MKEFFAHSAKEGHSPQTYKEHISNVYQESDKYAKAIEQYASKNMDVFQTVIHQSALLHDLGKLDDENQKVLCKAFKNHKNLPINHVDAGSAYFKNFGNIYSALLIYSHHKGLPNIQEESSKEDLVLRDEHPKVREHVDSVLSELLKRHAAYFKDNYEKQEEAYDGDTAIFLRMLLSCLADADHTDTAAFYKQITEKIVMPKLCAEERLAMLNKYVSALGGNDSRSKLRKEMYEVCRDANIKSKFSTCDSPVGSGKTTAVMAHLLQQAIRRKARRIFVVLPYTSIIKQSVDVYRNALLLPGENPEEVVAELHCRADFQDKDVRYLTLLWRAPIIVTTAVAFFETLASNRPAALRKLHELPGSVIFIDEAHNALPIKLLPLAWRWLNILAEEWGCYWVLASGSLVRYWELKALHGVEMRQPCVNQLVQDNLRERLMQYELNRVLFRWKDKSVNRKELIEWVQNMPGPRLLILNTVQSAAVIANDICTKYGRECVEHISTALTAMDRANVITTIKSRLNDPEDRNWTLVATSCVEAGVDFSFRTGFRELASLLSLLQAAGRVNRHGTMPGAEIWSFSLRDDSMLTKNPALEDSRSVLEKYFNDRIEITPNLSTQSMNQQLLKNDSCLSEIQKLLEWEKKSEFKKIEEEFNVIDSKSVVVIVDKELAELIKYGQSDWQTLQKNSISIPVYKKEKWHLEEIIKNKGIYQWNLEYDSFLGYMRGVLDLESAKNDILIF